ncbi:MAG: ATP-binding protein [Bryobacteraceae bacterium]
MTIGWRLTLAFGSVAFLIACGTAVAGWQFLSILRHERILAAVDDQVIAVYRVRADVGAIRRRLDSLSQARDAARFVSSAHQLREESFDDIEEAVKSFHETQTPVPGTLGALRDAIADEFDAMERLGGVNDWIAIHLRLENQVNDILDRVREMVENVNAEVSAERIRSIREIEIGERRSKVMLGLTAILSLAASLILGLYVTRSIVKPLSQLKSAAHQFALGDFNVTLETGSKDELGEVSDAFMVAARQLHDYYSALKSSNEALEQFAYATSHDLQEPLRTISAFSGLLKLRCGDLLPLEGKQYLSHLVDASTQMRELVEGILEYSRLASSADEREQALETEEIVPVVLNNLRAMIEQTHATVTHDELPAVVGNRLQLIQLFQNLVGNAIKYRCEGIPPRIHISAGEDGGMWRFCVEDNGIGIDPRYHAQVFGMFKQLTRGGQGVGMGLAISKRIVERHGGTISVASTLGSGSRFYFTLRRPGKAPLRSRQAASSSAVS